VNISTAAPAIKGEFGLNTTELGLIFSAFAYPYTLFQVFGGWLGDKWGARVTEPFSISFSRCMMSLSSTR
jgi:MFS family permease